MGIACNELRDVEGGLVGDCVGCEVGGGVDGTELGCPVGDDEGWPVGGLTGDILGCDVGALEG